MILWPVIDRELRVAARHPATYRTRLAAGLVATMLLAWANLVCSWRGASQASLGQTLFNTLSGLAFLYCLMTGARVTADCISQEKREGTLGLLFLTDLKGWHVVLGKFVAKSLHSFYGLLAIVPLLAIPLLLGGITLAQVGQMTMLLVNTLFCSLSMGILVSTLSRNERKAMFATALSAIVLLFAPLLAAVFCVFVHDWGQSPGDLELIALMLVFTPLSAFGYVVWPSLAWLRIPWNPPVEAYWISLGITHGIGWLCLMSASRWLPLIWRVQSRQSKWRAWEERLVSWFQARGAGRMAWRRRLLDINPYYWLALRGFWKSAYGWIFLAGIALTWIWGRNRYGDVMYDFYPAIPTILLIHGFLKLWVLSEATHRLAEDQRSGALEMVLSTPLTIAAMVKGQFLALGRQFGWPLLALAVAELLVFHRWYS